MHWNGLTRRGTERRVRPRLHTCLQATGGGDLRNASTHLACAHHTQQGRQPPHHAHVLQAGRGAVEKAAPHGGGLAAADGGGRRGSTCAAAPAARLFVVSACSDRRWTQHLAGRLLHSRVLGRLHAGCKRVGGCDGKFAGCREGDRQTACPAGLLCPLALTGQPVNETPAAAHPCVDSDSPAPRASDHCAAASCRRVNSPTWLRSKAPRCPARTSPPSYAPWVSDCATVCERGAQRRLLPAAAAIAAANCPMALLRRRRAAGRR